MTSASAVAHCLGQLQQMGLPRLEAQMLLLKCLGRDPQDRAWLWAHDEHSVTQGQQALLLQLAQRRLAGEPMAYLMGHKDFHALRLHVDARVLDPRDDTETLVQWALEVGPSDARREALDLVGPADAHFEALDLGTGSGAIALALAHARPTWQVSGSDASEAALEVAQLNARTCGLSVNWVLGHWLQPFAGRAFDLIVSNPPYIAEHDPHLLALRHEPRQALVSGVDGLDDIRVIVQDSRAHLKPGAWLLLEHGHDQALAVRELLSRAGFEQVSSRQDLAGVPRCSGGIWRHQQNFASREII
jgi:release factor glutamine methyltransferase